MQKRNVEFTPNVQVGIFVVVTVLLYLFFGLSSGEKILLHSTYYLMMFLGAILGSYLVFGNDIGEKLHFTTKNLPLANVILYGVLLGLMLATVETFTGGNTFFIQQAVDTTKSVVSDISGGVNLLSGIVFISLFSFITANAEETLTRGFFNSIAENYGDTATNIRISKYILIPIIFSLLHFFMWLSLGFLSLGGFVAVFLLMYHFVFAVVCQFAMDVTGSIYTPIAIHTIYNTTKNLIAIGIIAVGI